MPTRNTTDNLDIRHWVPIAITVLNAILEIAYRVLDRRDPPEHDQPDPISDLVAAAENVIGLLQRHWER